MKSEKEQRTDGPEFSATPWNTPTLWQAANASLSAAIQENLPAMVELYRIAGSIRKALASLFPVMDDLCRSTCPSCKDICCLRSWVWADFKDLLFFHLAGIDVPERQLLWRRGDHCHYSGTDGCRLDRLQRPFVCTWYICPAQTERLDHMPVHAKFILKTLDEVKWMRRKLEDDFILAVSGSNLKTDD